LGTLNEREIFGMAMDGDPVPSILISQAAAWVLGPYWQPCFNCSQFLLWDNILGSSFGLSKKKPFK